MDRLPFIAVRITTSSPILDLSKQEPFTINLARTLDYIQPITFDKRFRGLFDGKLLNQSGLTFRRLTGKCVPRGSKNICYMSSCKDGTPSEESKGSFVTLFPGNEHVIEATLKPILSNAQVEKNSSTSKGEQPFSLELWKLWKWPHVGGLEDRET
jgi:hypothetical protein